eukprot:18895-Heterococcus_DN1.PRE.1
MRGLSSAAAALSSSSTTAKVTLAVQASLKNVSIPSTTATTEPSPTCSAVYVTTSGCSLCSSAGHRTSLTDQDDTGMSGWLALCSALLSALPSAASNTSAHGRSASVIPPKPQDITTAIGKPPPPLCISSSARLASSSGSMRLSCSRRRCRRSSRCWLTAHVTPC